MGMRCRWIKLIGGEFAMLTKLGGRRSESASSARYNDTGRTGSWFFGVLRNSQGAIINTLLVW